MSIITLDSVFGPDINNCYQVIADKLDRLGRGEWHSLENQFCEFQDFKQSAAYHFPILMQIITTDDSEVLSGLEASVSISRIGRPYNVLRSKKILYKAKLSRIIRENDLKDIPGHVRGYSLVHIAGDDDPIDDSYKSYYESACENYIPEKDWWVTPSEEISDIVDNISALRNKLGLFHFSNNPPRLCLITYEVTESLRKPLYFDAAGYAGFWPSDEPWGRTVAVDGYNSGCREALQKFKSPIGRNQIAIFDQPNSIAVDWEDYCRTRLQILVSKSK
jgi:hypothetical protein